MGNISYLRCLKSSLSLTAVVTCSDALRHSWPRRPSEAKRLCWSALRRSTSVDPSSATSSTCSCARTSACPPTHVVVHSTSVHQLTCRCAPSVACSHTRSSVDPPPTSASRLSMAALLLSTRSRRWSCLPLSGNLVNLSREVFSPFTTRNHDRLGRALQKLPHVTAAACACCSMLLSLQLHPVQWKCLAEHVLTAARAHSSVRRLVFGSQIECSGQCMRARLPARQHTCRSSCQCLSCQ